MDALKISWTEFWSSIDILALQAKQLHIQSILAIGRGGLVPAVFLSHKLDIPMSVIMAKAYKGTELQSEIETSGIVGDLLKPKFMILDDIFDTGSTIKTVIERLKFNLEDYVVATVVTKQASLDRIAPIVVDKNQWIVFPYEK